MLILLYSNVYRFNVHTSKENDNLYDHNLYIKIGVGSGGVQ